MGNINSKYLQETDNAIVKQSAPGKGLGIFAKRNISKGELIGDWTGGRIYTAESAMKLVKNIRDYAIQIGETSWIDTDGIGRFFNHSCDPNCGFNGDRVIVTMRDVTEGEELTFDYEMCEKSDWRMRCSCGISKCRRVIGNHNNLPEEIRREYGQYISSWLR